MFKDRKQSGLLLADKLKKELAEFDPTEFVVLAIPRGGVVVGRQIAVSLNISLDVIIAKKLGAPNRPELALGAVGQTEGSLYLDSRIITELKIPQTYIDQEIKTKQTEITRRESLYRGNKTEIELKDKQVILVDDGAATGATIIAAMREVWNRSPKRVIIALPVCSKNTLKLLEAEADMVVVLETPEDFYAVGQYYVNFEPTTDIEVINLLDR